MLPKQRTCQCQSSNAPMLSTEMPGMAPGLSGAIGVLSFDADWPVPCGCSASYSGLFAAGARKYRPVCRSSPCRHAMQQLACFRVQCYGNTSFSLSKRGAFALVGACLVCELHDQPASNVGEGAYRLTQAGLPFLAWEWTTKPT